MENFGLKKDLAYEKKKYMDLMSAFLELRNSIKGANGGFMGVSPTKSMIENFAAGATSTREESLLKEKQALEATLMNLTEEVESLSKRNQEFLRELKAKHDFYGPYKDCQDELRKLREAHALLISMIQS